MKPISSKILLHNSKWNKKDASKVVKQNKEKCMKHVKDI